MYDDRLRLGVAAFESAATTATTNSAAA